MTEPGRPPHGGPLVSLREVLRTPADRHGRRLRAVLDAIDRLHIVPAMSPIEVLVTNDRGALGRYVPHLGTGEPVRIEISCRRNDRFELTFAHEIGHLLEKAIIPGSNFGSRNWASGEVTHGWRAAVRETEAYRRLGSAVATGRVTRLKPDGTTTTLEAGSKYVGYLMEDAELWARSYAQYIALRTQERAMLPPIFDPDTMGTSRLRTDRRGDRHTPRSNRVATMDMNPSRRNVRRLSKAYGMPESEVREMLAIASGRSIGDVVWVEDVRDLPPIRPTGFAAWIEWLSTPAVFVRSCFRSMIGRLAASRSTSTPISDIRQLAAAEQENRQAKFSGEVAGTSPD